MKILKYAPYALAVPAGIGLSALVGPWHALIVLNSIALAGLAAFTVKA